MTFYREHPRIFTPVGTATKAQQQFKAECDINNIMAKYMKTGLAAQKLGARYADLPSGVDYQEALNMLIEAETSFNSLPAQIRKIFDNDPGRFLAFATDPANENELVELGLANPRPPAEQSGGPAPKEAEPAAPEAKT